MLIQTQLEPVDHDHCCEILEAYGEGLVLAMMAEIRKGGEDEYPCCIKCGGFKIDPRRTVVDGAAELVRRGRACELSLVAYQVAQRRLEKDPGANLIVEHVHDANGKVIDGRYLFLLCQGKPNAAGKYEAEDPLEQLRKTEPGCNCPAEKGASL